MNGDDNVEIVKGHSVSELARRPRRTNHCNVFRLEKVTQLRVRRFLLRRHLMHLTFSSPSEPG